MSGKLSGAEIKRLLAAGVKGRTGDGDRLWLDVRGVDRGQWVFRYTIKGKAREAGLGRVQDVKLTDVRDEAGELSGLLRRGLDPLDTQVQVEQSRLAAVEAEAAARDAATRTFKSVAEEMLAALENGWSNRKHRQQWRNTLSTYAYPHFGSSPIAEVNTENVLSALEPIWSAKPETASRVRGRIESVLDFARAKGWRSGENPAAWRGHLKQLLPASSKLKTRRHHPALPWRDVPAFVSALRGSQGVAARALELTIHTAARSGEIRGMAWGEVDLKEATWTIPAGRMKAKREHRVPLSPAALKVLDSARLWRANDGPDALVFPGANPAKPLSDMSITAVVRRMNDVDDGPRWTDQQGAHAVPHGFRSSFRDWCAEERGEPREVAEAALAHTIGNAVEAAYRRGDLFERRRLLMDAWSSFLEKV